MNRKLLLSIILTFFTISVNAQNVKAEYRMNLSGILYESIILFDDGTFKLTNEYDLYFETFGIYEIIEDYLFLAEDDIYQNAIKLNPKLTASSVAKKIYKIGDDKIFITIKGKVKKRIVDKSLTKGLSNIFGHKYQYIKIQ
ncbi:hypothetical protein OBK16_13485 [Empedobacter falsenii]